MTVMVKCKNCGEDHRSGIQLDEDTFKTVTLTNSSENCSKCGVVSTYNKEEYFFQ